MLKVDEEIWAGDRMNFRVRALGQGASGSIDVAEDHVRLEVTLPWLLQKFAQAAQAAIRTSGKLLLEKNEVGIAGVHASPNDKLMAAPSREFLNGNEKSRGG